MTVWTPKRILMMVAGFLLFLTGYVVYAHFLGGIDGLPPLPLHYLPGPSSSGNFLVEGNSSRKFTQAFGKECPEKNWPIKLDLRRKRWVMASMDLKFLNDGRVRLTPFSAAYFPKRETGVYPEISTVQCEEAFLTLDRPVTNLSEMSHRKVMSVELRGKPGITIINNRSTEKKSDDIELQITKGPLFYEDNRNMIWTEGMVQLLDTQTQPHPTRIRAEGMDLFLTAKEEPTKQPAGKSSASPVGGVEKLILRRHVEMHLYVDAGSGFLGGQSNMGLAAIPKKKAEDKKPEKSHVIIRTRGSFTFLIPKDKAWFDSPKIDQTAALTPVHQVHVLREHKDGVVDQLLCSQLKLQFRAKERNPQPDGKSHRSVNKGIETAHAVSRDGQEIVLTMDSENLEAYGDELFYRSPSATQPSMTILKGKPMRAVKQGHKLRAVELHLFGATENGNDQKAIAFGPGQIDLFDKSNKKNTYPMHALWKDRLISSKDRQGETWMDLLTLIGDASFRDDEHDKELYGHRLLVWLEPTSAVQAKSQPLQSPSPSAPRHRPFKLEAFGSVMARSPKLLIPKADYLKVLFIDQVAPGDKLPATVPNTVNSKSAKPVVSHPKSKAPELKPAILQPPPNKKEVVRPLVLIARQIVTYVTRIGSKNELQEVVTEGKVHVHQEAERGKDNGVDIKGEMLHLVHHPEGDTVYVFGDSREPAMLQLGKLEIMGPKVTINQRENIAHVAGGGALKMPSNTTFDGKKIKDKNKFMRIHWNESMWFYGSLKSADFYGGVQAFQDDANMKCKTLQVTLDRVVSFKDGQERKESAKVDQFVCDGKVLVLDEKRDKNGKRVSLNRLEAFVLTVDNQQKLGNATGPGRVFLLGKGNGDPVLGDPKKKSGLKEQMYLTRIHFFARMYSIPGHNSRTYKFYDNIHVYHIPTHNPFAAIDPNKLPDGGFYLHCNLLTVLRRDLAGGKKSQEMQAQGNVSFRTKKFFGRADVVKYDEAKQQVIFQGKPGAPATLYEYQKGLPPKLIKGLKILYDRKTGKFLLDHSPLIQTRLERSIDTDVPGQRQSQSSGLAFRARRLESVKRARNA